MVGTYEFIVATPYLARHTTLGGEVLVAASTFAVLGPGILPFQNPEVLNASDYQYQVRYDFLNGTATAGTVTQTYAFRVDGPPKVTATLVRLDSGAYALTWVSLTLDRFAFNGTASVDFGWEDPPRSIDTPDFRISVGPNGDPWNWTRRVVFDWGDARAGSAAAGQFAFPGLHGAAILVRFPIDMATVDPSLVGTSTASLATKHTIQRKTFAHGDRFWAFWNDGGSIVYASSRDGKLWSAKAAVITGAPATGFDVDQRDGAVLVAYVPSTDTTRIEACKGSIDGSIIAWSCYLVHSGWPNAGVGPPTATIGTDGTLWVAVMHEYPAGINRLYVFRSLGFCTDEFCLDYERAVGGTPAQAMARVLAMPNGTLAVLTTWQGLPGESRIFQYTQSGWPAASEPIPYKSCVVNWDSTLLPQDVISAVPIKDGKARIVYRAATAGALEAVVYEPQFSWICSTPVTLDTRPIGYPTISIDRNGDSHVLYVWREAVSPNNFYHILYRRTMPLTDQWSSQAEEPIPSSVNVARTSATAAPFAPSHVAVVWTETDKTWFSAVPTPLDLGSQIGAPWSRQGISPYQTYFAQLGEFVSPTTGSLTVKQTDLTLPGRKLDLDITRVFVTPRAFTSGSTPSPYLHEEYPYASLGRGWRLNFPWISSQYVHLVDGQMYVLNWNGNDFENHAGEHFLLRRFSCGSGCYTYTLFTKGGVQYGFDSQGRPTSIADPAGNTITLNYASGRLDYVLDTVGRRVSFAYNGDGTLSSVSSGPLVVTYGYQTVLGLTMLYSVTDALGRKTLFTHLDTRTAYLLTGVAYATGAQTTFSWSNPTVALSSDLQAYFVTSQNTLNSQSASIRSNSFDYTAVNGKVSYVKATSYEAGVKKGSTTLHIDPYASRLITTTRDASDVQLSKIITWFGTRGEPEQTDFYPGSSPTPSQSTYAAYDDWGNVIYSRDGLGHERFASFLNTRFQGGFFAPGRLDRTASGLLFYDDFEDRDLNDWTRVGTVQLDELRFDALPPSLNLSSSGARAEHSFPAQSGFFFAEAIVNPGLLVGYDYVRLQAGSTVLVEIRFASIGEIQRKTGPNSWSPFATFVAGQWYRLTMKAGSNGGFYQLYLNGQLEVVDCLVGSGSFPYCTGQQGIDKVTFESSSALNVDAVKVWTSMLISLSGLRPGQIAVYSDTSGRTSASSKVPAGASSLTLTLEEGAPAFPYGTLVLLDEIGDVEFASPAHEFWGGDSWTYTRPWKDFPNRTRDGFLRATSGGVYLNDNSNKPPAVYIDDQDGWVWETDGFPVAGTESHRSGFLTGIHQHHFEDASPILGMTTGQYHIQYVYIPPGRHPSEIMLQFRDSGNSWGHRAFWGADLIGWGTLGTDSRRSMGGLPYLPGRWVMLIVKTDDVGPGTMDVEGLSFVLYGGMAAWDFSARGDRETGQIRISGLQQGWKANLYDAKGTLVAASPAAPADGIAVIDAYDPANPVPLRAFPFTGYFLVKDGANAAVYRSPVMSFWGGDTYNYAGSDAYPSANLATTIHDRPECTLEYQTGRFASTPIRQKTCVRYTALGLPDRVRVREEIPNPPPSPPTVNWRETSFDYDPASGLLTNVTDPRGNKVSLAYSATYGRSQVTKVWDTIGTRQRYTYDPATGWPLSVIDGRGYVTRYAYDPIGRVTMESRFDLPASSEVLYLDMEWTTEDPNPKLEDLSGRSNHATISGPTPTPGKVGFAREFSGTSQYARVTRSAVLEPARLTVSAWIFPHTTQATMNIVDKSLPDSTGSGYVLVANSDGSIQFSVYDGDTTPPSAVSPAGILRANAWQHVVGIHDGAYVRVFLDGVERAATAFSGSISYGDLNRDMWIGSKYDGNGRFFDGVIDEVRVFNAALFPADRSALFATTYRSLASHVIAYDDTGNVLSGYEGTMTPRSLQLDMESLLNGKLEDLGGKGRHGTMTGTGPATGRIGGARAFDGVDDYVTVSATPALNTPAFTAALWFRRNEFSSATLLPNANSGTPQWSRTGCASNYECVDEDPHDADSTYVYSGTTGHIDKYHVSDLPPGTAAIQSVTVAAQVRVPPSQICVYESGLPCFATLRLLANAYEGASIFVDEHTLYQAISQTWTTNPATGQAWTESEVNALQAGVKLVDTNWVARVTQLRVTVAVQGGGFQTSQGLIGKVSFANSWRIWARTDGKIEADAKSDAVGNLVSQTVGVGGIWYHVALTFDGATARLYVNGTQEASAATADWGGAYNSALWIGDTDSTSPFDGIIDEAHVLERVLAAAEIASLFLGTEKGFYEKAYFDVLGRTTRTVRRDLFQTSLSWQSSSYNFRDQVVSATVARSSALSFTTSFAYDFLGRPTSVTYPEYPADPVALSYDDVARTQTVVAENDRKIQYASDIGGRTTAVREYYDLTNAYTTSYTYDDVGNLLSVTNALNQVTLHQYDSLNRLTKTTYPDTTKYEQYTYDAAGNLETRRDRAGLTTVYTYDVRNRLDLICYEAGPCTSSTDDVDFDYDANDNLISVTTSSPAPVTAVAHVYDGLGRVLWENTTVGGTLYPVNYSYDRAGRLTRLTYPLNSDGSRSWVGYTYDPVGRTSSVYDPVRTYASFAYYADDLLKDITQENQVVQSYLYNGRGWPTAIMAMYQSTPLLDLPYTYDASGNVLTMGAAIYAYDKLDRLKTASGGFGSFSYDYDAIGNRKRLHYGGGFNGDVVLRPDGPTPTTQWSKSGSGGANWDRVDENNPDGDATYVYTPTTGNIDRYALTDLTQAGNVNSVTVTAVARGQYAGSCDPSGLGEGCYAYLKLRVNGYAGSTRMAGDFQTYAAASETWTTNPGTGQPWTLADVNSLEAGIEKATGLNGAITVRVTQLYVTVNLGNDATYAYSDGPTGLDQLTWMTGPDSLTTTFGYDANGNLRSKKTPTSWTCFEWNPENLMTKATSISLSSASCDSPTSPQQMQAYAYDGLGRRVKVDGAAGSGAWTVSIVSGMDVVFEKSHVDGQSSDQITRYIYANGMRIAKITPTGAVHYYLGDHLGSTRKVLDANRATVFSTEYTPFGKAYNVTGTEAYRYTMEKHDDPTGLVYLRARQYDPEIGRFVSADPVLGSLGNPQTLNRYPYVGNNPLTYTDPTGEFWWLLPAVFLLLAGTSIGVTMYGYSGNWEDILLPLGFLPVLDTAVDLYFAISDCNRARGNPTPETLGWCGADIGFLALPLVGASWMRAGARIADAAPWGRADDVPLPHALNGGPANTHVYLGIDLRTGKYAYVGITDDFARRSREWQGVYRLRQVTTAPVTRGEARAIEETLIVNNPHFNNKIHSISPRLIYYWDAEKWGEAWLGARGIPTRYP